MFTRLIFPGAKLNTDKTDIMVFSIKNLDLNRHFNFNIMQSEPVASHRHLSYHFSLYCKWAYLY